MYEITHKNGEKMRFSKKVLTTLVIIAFTLAAFSVAGKNNTSTKQETIILSDKNTLTLMDAVNGESVSQVIARAKQLDKNSFFFNKNEPIYLFIRSPGGSVQAGLEMLEALKGLNRPVHTITMFSASMAFQTVQQLGTRYAVKSSTFMSHQASGGFEGNFGGKRPNQIDSRKNFWEERLLEMDIRTVERTNGKQTLDSYQTSYTPELWLTGKQAVEKGYADAIVNVKCDESLSGSTTKSAALFGLLEIEYDQDDCPLNSAPMNVRIARIATNKGVMKMSEFTQKNGGFGSYCLVASGTNSNVICATDLTLSYEKINEIKSNFVENYIKIESRTIPFRF